MPARRRAGTVPRELRRPGRAGLPANRLQPANGVVMAAPSETVPMVVAQRGVRARDLSDRRGPARRGGGLVSRAQHARQHARAGIQSGFDFLQQPAGFAISESLCEFDSSDSLRQGLPRSACRTRCASRSLGIVLATITGTLDRHRAAVAELPHPLALQRVRRDCSATCRCCCSFSSGISSSPNSLPPIDEALQPLPGVFFSKNGLQYPIPIWAIGSPVVVVAGARRHRRRLVLGEGSRGAGSRPPGSAPPVFLPALGLVIVGMASSAGSRAARRRRSTFRRRPRSPSAAAARSRRNSSRC